MFKKIPFRRIFLFALIVSIVWTITACNQSDNGVAPTNAPLDSNFPIAPIVDATTIRTSWLPGHDFNFGWSQVNNTAKYDPNHGSGQWYIYRGSSGNSDEGYLPWFGIFYYPDWKIGFANLKWQQPQGISRINFFSFADLREFEINFSIDGVTIPSNIGSTTYTSYNGHPYFEMERIFPVATGTNLGFIVKRLGSQSVFYCDNLNVSGAYRENIQFQIEPDFRESYPYGTLLKFKALLYYHPFYGQITIEKWASSIDGDFGSGLELSTSALSVGSHTITLFARGSSGQPLTAAYSLVITPSKSPLKIVSPVLNRQYIFGEMINFVGTYTGSVTSISWESDLDGAFQGTPLPPLYNELGIANDNLRVGTHRITLKGKSDGQWVSASMTVNIYPPKIELINLDAPADPTDSLTAEVSYRKAKTPFKAIGRRPDGSIVDPYSVDWGLEGGDVNTPLRIGVLSQLTTSLKIGDFETWQTEVAKSPIAMFVSYLPGNITITAKRGTGSASVAVRIKQPTLKIAIHPIEGTEKVVEDISAEWEGNAKTFWQLENIINIESVTLHSPISNVTYPNPPLDPLPMGYPSAELLIQSMLGLDLDYLRPLVEDFLSRDGSGQFILPRQLFWPFSHREEMAINVYVVKKLLKYEPVPYADRNPQLQFTYPEIHPVTSRSYAVSDSSYSGVVLRNRKNPKDLTQCIGCILGLSNVSGSYVKFDEIVKVLDYNNDNPQNLALIKEN